MRYLRVLWRFWTTALAAELEYRGNFFLAALSALGGAAGSLFGISLLYQGGYQPGGWRFEEALLVLAAFLMLDGFSLVLLYPNLGRIVEHVQKGTLDFVLLKPIDSQFWLSFRSLSPWGLSDGLIGLGLWFYAAGQLGLGWMDHLRGIFLLASAMLMLYSLWFVIGATSIYFVKVANAVEVLRALLEAGRFPVQAFPPAYRFVFTFLVPVAFLTTVPAEAVLGRLGPASFGLAVGLALALLLGARLFWRLALRSYTSASS
ncbi:ABC transporter permease [Meiothermus sp. QL-1]|uniref:ABC transporter permease n=1 Tax=Meiothermus sp. QL-1 TaxID=2058095 RepID=UPI000E0B1E20|nr:ABC-2 family transporter protein [Meiothermus sp. QL-1]RDI95881.1 ABC transporter permease [Meiothermus sp. QL-1]